MSSEDSSRLVRLRARLKDESSDSRKLAEDLADNPICSVTFDPSVPCIVTIWKRYATRAQFCYIHERILQLLEKHSVNGILGDDTALPTILSEDQNWLVENWMPRAIAAGLKFAASKTPDAHFGKVSIERIQGVAPSGVILKSFDRLDDAKDWLRQAVAPR